MNNLLPYGALYLALVLASLSSSCNTSNPGSGTTEPTSVFTTVEAIEHAHLNSERGRLNCNANPDAPGCEELRETLRPVIQDLTASQTLFEFDCDPPCERGPGEPIALSDVCIGTIDNGGRYVIELLLGDQLIARSSEPQTINFQNQTINSYCMEPVLGIEVSSDLGSQIFARITTTGNAGQQTYTTLLTSTLRIGL